MKKKTAALLLLIAIIGVIIGGAAYAQNANSAADKQADTQAATEGIPTPLVATTKYMYAAKYVCGDGSNSLAVVPAKYMTAINVHNPQSINVTFTKKVAQASREEERAIPPSPRIKHTIGIDYAFEIDCQDIWTIVGTPTAALTITGFVVIESPKQLDVTAVYTSIGTNNDVTLDVEAVSPKAIIPQIAAVAADLPID